VALVVGWLLGGETFSENVLVGLPVVLGSVALHAWIHSRETPLVLPKVPLGTAPRRP
jgi:hypothetical protein